MARKPSKAKLERMLDVRVRDRYLAEGSIEEAAVEKYIDALHDCTDRAEYVDLPSVEPGEGDEATGDKPSDE